MLGEADMTARIQTAEASLCETCTDPGRCCRRFSLNIGWFSKANWKQEAEKALEQYNVPFYAESIYKEEAEMVVPWFSCTKLGGDGRCTIYDERPHVCRTYKPGSDELCAMHKTEPGSTT
jgi:Fe-S-cluster containining protein